MAACHIVPFTFIIEEYDTLYTEKRKGFETFAMCNVAIGLPGKARKSVETRNSASAYNYNSNQLYNVTTCTVSVDITLAQLTINKNYY